MDALGEHAYLIEGGRHLHSIVFNTISYQIDTMTSHTQSQQIINYANNFIHYQYQILNFKVSLNKVCR